MARLDQVVARNLGLSRSVTTRLFKQGRVRDPAGGRLDPKEKISGEDLPRDITVDGHPERLYGSYHVILHKPAGVVTAMRDRLHPVAWDLVAQLPLAEDLRAVGRLDLDTTGLLLWTTDGELVHRMTHPRHAMPRTYHAALAGEWADPAATEIVLDGDHRPTIVALDGLERHACHPALLPAPAATRWASITLTSGKFHEVKRIFSALGTEVLALCRVSHGPVELPHDLPSGHTQFIDLPARVQASAG